jgi:hypothetical protein
MYGKSRQAIDENILRRISIACWITMVTHKRSASFILIVFPLQQLLRERAIVSRMLKMIVRFCV